MTASADRKQFTELTDSQWAAISPFLPVNRKRTLDLRDVMNAYVHNDSTWNLELSEHWLDLDVLLRPAPNAHRERIRIPLDQICRVYKNQLGGTFMEDDLLFYAAGKLEIPSSAGQE